MKRLLLLTAVCFFGIVKAKSQVILNEIYTDPGAGKEEFFELYNTSGSTVPMSLDDYSIVTFFELSGKRGFYVLDLPNLTINPQGFFVGSSSIPFDCQSLSGSTSSNFSWNDEVTLAATNGYLKNGRRELRTWLMVTHFMMKLRCLPTSTTFSTVEQQLVHLIQSLFIKRVNL